MLMEKLKIEKNVHGPHDIVNDPLLLIMDINLRHDDTKNMELT